MVRLAGWMVVGGLVLSGALWAEDPPAVTNGQGVDFFEKKIRPILVAECYRCHSADAQKGNKLKGNLFLDSRDGLLKGGDSGPALVPGKAGDSLLIKALHYDDEPRMPPRGKLPASVIADFERWVAMGAPDPRTIPLAARKPTGMSLEEGRRFWAYRPPAPPAIPEVQDSRWPLGSIDRFILKELETRSLFPAAPAERSVLARRVYFDLTGLPPTPEEVAAFVHDPAPDAYERMVDRLLAAPQFGERWGRHWLDVARYAESLTLRGFVFKEAWRYRDYVIEAFNQDMPFNQFIREQIAGDLLDGPTIADRRRQRIATTFLVLGNTNLEEQDKKQLRMDVVDEQLDVIAKGFLAQTVTCARCHDHKFDPIPTRDYYALAGILRNARAMEHANVSKWLEAPLPNEPEEEARLVAHEKRVAALQTRIQVLKGKTTATAKAVGVLPVAQVQGVVVDDAQAKRVGEWQHSIHSGVYIGDGYTHDMNSGKGEKTLTFEPVLPATGRYEVRLAYSPGGSRSAAVPATVFSAEGEKTILVDMKKTPPLDGRFVSLGDYRFEKTGQSFVILSNEGTKGHVTADAVVFLAVDQRTSSGSEPKAAASSSADQEAVRRLEAELKELQESGPRRPMAMTVFEEKEFEDARIHVRGLVGNQGEKVPRGFLQVALAGPAPTLPAKQSGRRELAAWIASNDNPLTARVIVNRVWHWLMGSGIVRTTDNFGTTGEPPSHSELLDHLALEFQAEGWSIKKLVRRIVLSQTYRQSTRGAAATLAADPENRLFGRAQRRRLEAECLRDLVLSASGRLRQDQGGPTYPASLAADYGYQGNHECRSVYLPWFRNAMPEMVQVFDGPDPSMVTGVRTTSTVAPQALFMLNHPWVVEQSRHAAARLLAEGPADPARRLRRAYAWTLGRSPTAAEEQAAQKHLASRPNGLEAWAAVFHALFASAEFRYLQ